MAVSAILNLAYKNFAQGCQEGTRLKYVQEDPKYYSQQ